MMIYKQIKKVDTRKDIILPCKKGDLESLKSYISIENLNFDGAFSTYQTVYGTNGNRIYVLGIGEEKDKVKLEDAFRKLCFDTKKYWSDTIQVITDALSSEDIKKAAIGLELGTYEIGKFKSKKEDWKQTHIEFLSSKKIGNVLEEGKLTGETINRIKALVDAPANHKTPEFLGNWAKESSIFTLLSSAFRTG